MARAEERAVARRARFAARLAAIYPEHHEAVLEAQARPRGAALLVPPWRAGIEETAARLAADGIATEPLAAEPPALFVPAGARPRALRHPLCTDGTCFALDAASLAVAMAVAPQPGMRVLDACAAPGGKTLALAAMLRGRGGIVAVEKVRARFFRLRAVLARAGASGVETRLGDARRLAPRLGPFDAALVDAPCSTEARLDPADPASFRYWSERKIAEQARKQKGLLLAAARALAPGGRLVYATCSHAPEENEAAIAWLLARAPWMEPVPAPNPLGLPALPGLVEAAGRRHPDAVAHALRILPGARNGAMFVAVLQKARKPAG